MDPRDSALYVPEVGGDKLKIPLEAVYKSEVNLQLSKEVNPQKDDPMVKDPMEEVSATILAKLSKKKYHMLYMGVINEA